MDIAEIDNRFIAWLRKYSVPFARWALFVIFFWFGILKVIDLSPAGPLVETLFYKTIPWMPFAIFYKLFGLYECLIGLLFLVPKATRVVVPLLAFHMFATFLPLMLVPELTWQGFLVPTLEGQYIMKNLVIIAAAMGVAANVTPISKR